MKTHAPITPNFPSGSNCEIVGVRLRSEIDVGPPLFTSSQSEMPTDGVRIGRCDQPLKRASVALDSRPRYPQKRRLVDEPGFEKMGVATLNIYIYI